MPGLGPRLQVLDAKTHRAPPSPPASKQPMATDWRMPLLLTGVAAAGAIATIVGTLAALTGAQWGTALAIVGIATIGAAAVSWLLARQVNDVAGMHALFVLGLSAIALDSFWLRAGSASTVTLVSPLLATVGILLLVPLRHAAPYVLVTGAMQGFLIAQANLPVAPWLSTFASMSIFAGFAAYRRDSVEASLKANLRQQQQAREELAIMVDRAPDAYAVLDAAGKFMRWNERCAVMALEMTGRPPREGSSLWEEFAPETALRLVQCTQIAFDGKAVEISLALDGQSNQRRWQLVLTPAEMSMDAGVLLMLREVSEADALIEDHREQMHQSRLSLLNVASHDLRTPLTPLVMEASLLASSRLGPLTPAQGQAVSVIVRNIARLRRFVDHLASAYDFEHNPPPANMETDSLAEVLDSAAMDAAELEGVPCPIIGAVDPALNVEVDADLLRQAIVHLVENAALHAPRDTDVLLEAGVVGDQVVIHVRDQGAVPQHDPAARLFEPFHEDLAATETRAHGLSLHLANKCMEIIGGSLDVCQDHTDACFALQFPLGRASTDVGPRRRPKTTSTDAPIRDES